MKLQDRIVSVIPSESREKMEVVPCREFGALKDIADFKTNSIARSRL